MKTKIKNQLKDKCKDFGLSEDAINDLVEAAVKGMKEDATDEDITKTAEMYVPIAKAMQAEYTRKLQAQQSRQPKSQPSNQQQNKAEEGNGKGGNGEQGDGGGNDTPEWAKALMQQMEAIKADNAALKAEKAKAERAATISAKAKELGIPEVLMKRFSVAEDADIEKELSEYKQELVNSSLMPENGGAGQRATEDKLMEAEADRWVKTLPDK